jgi:hypothetical protein
MGDKYSPLHLASYVWSKFWGLYGHQDATVEDYSIYIEIKQTENECYLIKPAKTGYLWRGTLFGTEWKPIFKLEELNTNKDLLSTVHIRFKEEPVKIKDKILEPFPNYNLFWSYITR